jgi:hypothetical protein
MPAATETLAQARPFRAQHPRHWSTHIGGDEAFAACVGAQEPDAALLHLPHRAGQVRDRDDGNRIGRAARRLGHGGVDADGPVLGDDDRLRPERIGAAQTGAEVVRIRHAVQHQQQRRCLSRLEYVVQRDVRQRVVDDGHDALVPPVSSQRVETGAIDGVHGHARRFRARHQVAQACVLPPRKHIEVVDRIRTLAQPRGDGVKTEQGARSGHSMVV